MSVGGFSYTQFIRRKYSFSRLPLHEFSSVMGVDFNTVHSGVVFRPNRRKIVAQSLRKTYNFHRR
jgi:hypothetical protein